MTPYLFIRSLRYVEHSVFAVDKTQKFYKDPIWDREIGYSSGQQVKRSILETMTAGMNVPFAPITFNWVIKLNKKGEQEAKQGEAWSSSNPSFPDQLIGGYMKTPKDASDDENPDNNEDAEPVEESEQKASKDSKGAVNIRRRSPLSISAFRPLHPLLGGLEKQPENMTYDRTSYAQQHTVKVWMETTGKKNQKERREMSAEEVEAWLRDHDRLSLPPQKLLLPQRRVSGLFVVDIAIDLRRLFCVSLGKADPELDHRTSLVDDLKAAGWVEGENVFGRCLICPKEQREQIIPALADALLNWRITSNQARTFSLMDTLAVAISDNANQVAYAVRAELDTESEYNKARPVIDQTAKAQIYLAPTVSGYIKGETGNTSALDDARAYLEEQLWAFPYEAQMQPATT